MTIKLLIADDDALIREGLRMILGADDGFEVAACVENGRLAVDYCLAHPVDVALLDVRMPVMNGVEAVREIIEKTLVKPLILTTFDDDAFIADAVRFGARGYLLKNNPPERIKDAIRAVHSGYSVMQDVVMEKIKGGISGTSGSSIDRTVFSERELEVMELIAKGLSNKEIAKTLFISEGTVANYITAIFNKTGLETRTQIAIYFLNK